MPMTLTEKILARAAGRQLFRLLCGGDDVKPRRGKCVHGPVRRPQLGIELGYAHRVVPQRFGRHRAVHMDRQHGDAPLDLESP